MSLLSVSLAILATICSVIYLVAYSAAAPSLAKSILKTASTLLLAISAAFAGGPFWLIAALGLGALGDLLLSRDGERAFLFGLISFAIAHLAYVGLFLFDAAADAALLAQGSKIVAVILLLAFGTGMARLLWPAAGDLRVPVMTYILIIMAMGLAALALPDSAGLLPLLAAFFFIASDAILAGELFLLSERHPLRRITPYAVWTLYWGAQAMFLLAFVPVAGT